MVEQLLEYDTELFLFLNNLGNTSWDGFWRVITEKLTSIPLYLVLLFLIHKHYGWKGAIVTIVSVALMITVTDQLSNLFKDGFKRVRPCQLAELEGAMRFVGVRCGKYGYFSAHAASSMAAAVFLGLCLKKWYKYLPFLLLFWAVIIGYSRIYLGVHYPLDVVTGMALGGLLGWSFFMLQLWGQRRFNPEGSN